MTPSSQSPIQRTGSDVSNKAGTQSWFYSDIVKDHFFHPHNFLKEDEDMTRFNAMGHVGSPACGDELRVWLHVDTKTERIKEFRWKTFGCGSAIAAASMCSILATEGEGMTLEEARTLKPQTIIERLGGLPSRKFHCSVLCDKALRDAINDYYRRTQQKEKIMEEAARILDPSTGVTDRDIEEAVLEGAVTLEKVQQKTKVGIGNPSILPHVEELIRFYREKYFG